MHVLSVRQQPATAPQVIGYFQSKWANPDSMMVYEDCIKSCLDTASPLPQWYLLMDGEMIAGCAGLITNDFISRMDLYPWLCALYVEPEYRGKGNAGLLIEKCKEDARQGGFRALYLCTDHEGFYERYGFTFIGTGHHPWGESSRIYMTEI